MSGGVSCSWLGSDRRDAPPGKPAASASPAGLQSRHARAGAGYNSIAADPRPIFIDYYELDTAQPAPAQVSAKLTLNGVTGQEYFYDTALLNGGNIVQIALQGDATGLSTGRYAYSIEITAHYATPAVTTHSGSVNIINSDSSEFGDGWSRRGQQRLHFVSAAQSWSWMPA